MLQPLQLQDVSARYPDEIEELRAFLQSAGLVLETKDSLHALSLRLQQGRAFRRDLTSYLWIVMYRSPRHLRHADTLGVLAIATAGEEFATQANDDDAQALLRVVMDARQSLEAAGSRDNIPVAAPIPVATPRPELVPRRESQQHIPVAIPQEPFPPVQQHIEHESFLSPARPFSAQYLASSEEEETGRSRKPIVWIAACALLALAIGAGIHYRSAFDHFASDKSEAPPPTATAPAEPIPALPATAYNAPTPHPELPAPHAATKKSAHTKPVPPPAHHTPATITRSPAPAPAPAVSSAAPTHTTPTPPPPSKPVQVAKNTPPSKTAPSGPVVPRLGIAPAYSASDMTNVHRSTQTPHLERRTPEERGELLADNRAPASTTPKTGPTGTVHAVTLGSTASRVIYSPTPAYPAAASSAHVQGEVRLQATVDAEGNVTNVRVISGPPLLREAALDAAQRWRYRPSIEAGEPASMSAVTVFAFQLPTQ